MLPKIQKETFEEVMDADDIVGEAVTFKSEQPMLAAMMIELAARSDQGIDRLAGMSTLYALLKAQIAKDARSKTN